MNRPDQQIKTVEDWHNLLGRLQSGEGINLKALRNLRTACWRRIEELRNRPLLVYAVQYPGEVRGTPVHIDLSDIDGFIDLVESTNSDNDEVDILIHSPGGDPTATERIVEVLRGQFKKIFFLVPHSAYSAATMLTFSGDGIVLHPTASLGPIDPQINGIPARSILRGFDRAKKTLPREGPEAIPAYAPLIEKHSLEMLELCEYAEELSKELAGSWLNDYMFAEKSKSSNDKTERVNKIVDFFAEYDEHKIHTRPLTYRKLQDLGLKIELADGELKDLLRRGYLLLQGFFSVTPFIKIFENSSSLSWGRVIQGQPPPEPSPADPK